MQAVKDLYIFKIYFCRVEQCTIGILGTGVLSSLYSPPVGPSGTSNVHFFFFTIQAPVTDKRSYRGQALAEKKKG